MKTIKLPNNLNINIDLNIKEYLNPPFVYIPVKDTFNYPNYVYKNDYLFSSFYSPISGKVLGINNNYLVIKNDFMEMKNPKAERKSLDITKDNILKVLKYYHEDELYLKLRDIDIYNNIIVSTVSDEPYTYNELILLKERIDEVLEIFDKLITLSNSDISYLVVKSNISYIIDECLNKIGTYPNIKLTLVNDEYLLEKELFLKQKLKLDKNTLFLKVSDIYKIYSLLKKDNLSTRLITICGNAIKESFVLRVKKYSKLQDIINNYVILNDDNYIVYINGLMNGLIIDLDKDYYLTDDCNSIYIMKKIKRVVQDCIDCNSCKNICPVGVNPCTLENKDKCINCGLCSFICPVNINLRRHLSGEDNE